MLSCNSTEKQNTHITELAFILPQTTNGDTNARKRIKPRAKWSWVLKFKGQLQWRLRNPAAQEGNKRSAQNSMCGRSAATTGNHCRTCSRGISITLKPLLFLERVTHTTNAVEKSRLKSICQQIGGLYSRICKGYKPFRVKRVWTLGYLLNIQ